MNELSQTSRPKQKHVHLQWTTTVQINFSFSHIVQTFPALQRATSDSIRHPSFIINFHLTLHCFSRYPLVGQHLSVYSTAGHKFLAREKQDYCYSMSTHHRCPSTRKSLSNLSKSISINHQSSHPAFANTRRSYQGGKGVWVISRLRFNSPRLFTGRATSACIHSRFWEDGVYRRGTLQPTLVRGAMDLGGNGAYVWHIHNLTIYFTITYPSQST